MCEDNEWDEEEKIIVSFYVWNVNFPETAQQISNRTNRTAKAGCNNAVIEYLSPLCSKEIAHPLQRSCLASTWSSSQDDFVDCRRVFARCGTSMDERVIRSKLQDSTQQTRRTRRLLLRRRGCHGSELSELMGSSQHWAWVRPRRLRADARRNDYSVSSREKARRLKIKRGEKAKRVSIVSLGTFA